MRKIIDNDIKSGGRSDSLPKTACWIDLPVYVGREGFAEQASFKPEVKERGRWEWKSESGELKCAKRAAN